MESLSWGLEAIEGVSATILIVECCLPHEASLTVFEICTGMVPHGGNFDITTTVGALDRGQEARIHGRHSLVNR